MVNEGWSQGMRKMEIFDKYYDEHNLEERSQYSGFSKKQLVIEAEHLENALSRVLVYLENNGDDLDFIRTEVMDGLYESRI